MTKYLGNIKINLSDKINTVFKFTLVKWTDPPKRQYICIYIEKERESKV